MVSQTATPGLKPWETEPAAPPSASLVPQDRVYVFYPEGLDAWINIPGRGLVKFTNGRVMSDIDRLSDDHLKWLGAQKNTDGSPRFLFCIGDPRQDPLLAYNLQQRFTRVAAQKAAASEALAIVDDVTFMVMRALYVTGDETNGRPVSGQAGQLRAIETLLPYSLEEVQAKQQLSQLEAQERDDEVIRRASQGVTEDDDTPKPEDGTPAEPVAPTTPFAKS